MWHYLLKPIFGLLLVLSKPLPVTPLPVVLLHGIDSSSEQLQPFSDWISDTFAVPVFNIEIGNGVKTSLYSPLTLQVDALCQTISQIEELEEGFNLIGMSQGGLIARGYIEWCNEYPVHNLITLVSPHGGVFCKETDITKYAYSAFSQRHLSLAGYWRNPQKLATYLEYCLYLPRINNEIEHNNSVTQMNEIKSLANFVMVWSPYDEILCPPESGKFSFFAANMDIIPLTETEIYQKDLLGLKYLAEENRLHIFETNCSHVDHRNEICYSQLYPIFAQFLSLPPHLIYLM